MKKLLRIFILLTSIVAAIVFPQHIVRSCGPMLESDEAMYLLFQRDMPEARRLESFYYTERFLNGERESIELGYDRNCREWHKFSGNKFNVKEVFGIQYDLSPDDFLYSLHSGNWGTLADNGFIKWLLQPGNKDALDYMTFAKQLEYLQTTIINPWNDNGYPDENTSDVTNEKYITLLHAAFEKCSMQLPVFLRQRYAFQAIKIMQGLKARGYQNKLSRKDYDSLVIRHYELYLKNKNTVVSDWSSVAYAAAQPDKKQFALEFVRIFDRTKDRKIIAFRNIAPEELSVLEHTVKDKKTLAAILAIKAMKNTGRAMHETEQLYKTDRNSPYLKLLIGREVNKLEDWLLSGEMKDFQPDLKWRTYLDNSRDKAPYAYFAEKNRKKDSAYLSSYKQLLIEMLHSGTADPMFTKLAIVRLCHIQKKFDEGAEYLKTIPRLANKTLERQRQIEQIVNLAYTGDLALPDVQKKLYNKMVLLEKSIPRTAATDDESLPEPGIDGREFHNAIRGEGKDIINSLILLLSRRYAAKGDVVKAALLFDKSPLLVNGYYGISLTDSGFIYSKIGYFDKFASVPDVDRLLAFKHKRNKTAFEQYISPATWPDDNIFRDLKGTLLVRQGKFEEALSVFNQMPDDFWEKNYEFTNYLSKTSITSLGSILPVVHATDTLYKHTSKKAILRDIVMLRANLRRERTDAAIAKTAFLLANCMYNMTYWGKDWILYSYGWSEREIDPGSAYNQNYKWARYSFYPNSDRYGDVYYRCRNAIDLYKTALAHSSSDRELSAQCWLMLIECDKMRYRYRQHRYQTDDLYNDNNKGLYRVLYPGFAHYKKYRNTRTYQNSITECPDIEGLNKRY